MRPRGSGRDIAVWFDDVPVKLIEEVPVVVEDLP